MYSLLQRMRSRLISISCILETGAIVQAYTFEYKNGWTKPKKELLSLGIVEMRNRFKSTAREIIVPFLIWKWN